MIRFSWRAAILGRWNIFHLQWPEHVFSGSTLRKRLAKLVLGCLLAAKIVLLRIPVVYTVHNLRSHEKSHWTTKFLSRTFDSLVDLRIYLNDSTENSMDRGVVILHAAYPQTHQNGAAAAATPGLLLYFGQIRPYKGLERLITAFHDLRTLNEFSGARLRIVGRPTDEAYAASIRELARGRPGIEIDLGHQPDESLERQIRECQIVVLPYRHIYNSGAAVLALGLGTPVLLPRSASTESLAREVGPSLGSLFEGGLDSIDLVHALKSLSRNRERTSAFRARRDPLNVGRLHGHVYSALGAFRSYPRAARGAAVATFLRTTPDFMKHAQ